MRYATIGTGWITDAFIEGAKIAGGLKLAAIYSRSESTGKAFAAKYGEVPVFTIWKSSQSRILLTRYISQARTYSTTRKASCFWKTESMSSAKNLQRQLRNR